ncbi:MAG: hypothetical protein E7J90_11535 [Cutibacterium avidum]|nr:hypothetical protein [Cutibacterium avidum]
MTLDETADLLRTIRAICPAQAQDEFTPEAWNLVLDDIAMPDAMAAVRRIARSTDTKPLWIDPRQILNEVRRVRTARLDATPTSGAPTDPAAYCQWLKATRQHIASGNRTDTPALECPPDAQKHPSDATEAQPRAQ